MDLHPHPLPHRFHLTPHHLPTTTTLPGIRSSAIHPAHLVERPWLQLFEDPSMWWDSRNAKRNPKCPDFVHADTMEALWIDSHFCPKWVQSELNTLHDSSPAPGLGVRARFRGVRGGSAFRVAGRAANASRSNEFTWTKLISELTKRGRGREALRIYKEMREEAVTPKTYTFVAALKACSSVADLEAGKEVHAHVIENGVESDIFVASTLVDMYAKCGSMVDARQVFEKMPHRNVVSWTAMILGYAQKEAGQPALELYSRMLHEGCTPNARTFVAALKACGCLAEEGEGKQVDGELVKIGCLEKGRAIHSQVAKGGFESDIFVASTLVDMYVKCGSMANARRVFEKTPHRDVVLWNSMILGYAQEEAGEPALELYACMQHEGFTPDAHTFVAALMVCGSLAALESGKEIHAAICRVGLEGDAFVSTCLVNMYGKCGSMVDAQQLFDALPARDVVSWNALIAGYSRQGDSEYVFNLVDRMQREGIEPNGITFVSVLTVCSHTGLVDKARKYFQAMCSDYGITPASEHYSCMIDLLGRAGQLDEAVAMVTIMPFKPKIVIWMTILGAGRKWTNVNVGRCAFECAVRLDEKNASAYMLMIHIYVSARMWDESAKIEAMRNNAQASKKPGQCSWTDSAGIVHTFLVKDKNHSQMEEEGMVCA